MLNKRTKLDDWLEWLENTRPETKIDLGLDRVKSVANKLNLLKPAPYIITVAGTNGKGSTVSLLENILVNSGYNVASLTSPHILKFNERTRINKTPLSDHVLCEGFAYIDQNRDNTWISYFEFTILVAFYCFLQQKLDIVILEIGLGGRLDACNIVDHDLSIITTVGLDHQEFLGNSIEDIAKEKAGIMRANKPVVYGDPEVPLSIVEHAKNINAHLYRNNIEFSWHENKDSWSFQGKKNLTHLPFPKLVIDNAATVIQACQLLPFDIPHSTLISCISSTKLFGRCTQIQIKNSKNKTIELIFDVGHNPQAIQFLIKNINKLTPKPLYALFGVYKDKDYKSIIHLIHNKIKHWFVTQADHPRSMQDKDLLQEIVTINKNNKMNSTAEIITFKEFKKIPDLMEEDSRLIIFGSFKTIENALTLLPKTFKLF